MDNHDDLIRLIGEKFPRIGEALSLRWSQKEFNPYVDQLLNDERGTRKGFPEDVVIALFDLQDLHRSMYPKFLDDNPTVWL